MKNREGGAEERFVVDAMLGRLARWLRILGFDTLYDPHAADDNLIRIALRDNRLLLTRDRSLASVRRPNLRTLFIAAESHRGQLKEMLERFRPLPGIGSRCLVCNTLLEDLAPEGAAGLVPDYILQTHRRFRRCPGCRRVYWPGSHLEDIHRVLEDLGVHRGADPAPD